MVLEGKGRSLEIMEVNFVVLWSEGRKSLFPTVWSQGLLIGEIYGRADESNRV